MSIWNVCKCCFLRHRATTNLFAGQIRLKTYKKSIGRIEQPVLEPVARDVIVYAHRKGRHVLSVWAFLFGASMFLASTGYSFKRIGVQLNQQTKKRTPDGASAAEENRWGIDMFKFRDGKFHKYFAFFFFGLCTLTFIGLTYMPIRYIRSVKMMKDGVNVNLTTYAPFGSNKSVVIPLSKVSAMHGFREGSSTYVKSANHYLPFYLSSTGDVLNPTLLFQVLTSTSRKSS